MTLSGKRVLIFAAKYYEELELWYPKIRLEEEGCATVVAGVGEKVYYGKSGSYPVTVDAHVDEVNAADFDGLVARHPRFGQYLEHHLPFHERLLRYAA